MGIINIRIQHFANPEHHEHRRFPTSDATKVSATSANLIRVNGCWPWVGGPPKAYSVVLLVRRRLAALPLGACMVWHPIRFAPDWSSSANFFPRLSTRLQGSEFLSGDLGTGSRSRGEIEKRQHSADAIDPHSKTPTSGGRASSP